MSKKDLDIQLVYDERSALYLLYVGGTFWSIYKNRREAERAIAALAEGRAAE